MAARSESAHTRDRGAPTIVLLGVAAAGLVLCIGAVALAVANAPPERRAAAGILRGAMVAAPLLVGLLVLRRRGDDRFAWLLVAGGLCFSLTALAESREPVPYSAGRVLAWLVEPGLAYLMLTFPSGRVTGHAERILLAAITLVAATLYLPTALLVEHFPEPSPWSTCGTACPPNVFALTDTTPAVVDDALRPLRETLTVVLFAAVAVLLVQRARRAGPLLRLALTPVAFMAAMRAVAMAAYFIARAGGDEQVGPALEALGWVWAMALPAVALSFGAGLINRRAHAAGAFTRLATALRSPAEAVEVRKAMAEALEDPSLQFVSPVAQEPGRWVDDAGRPVSPPRPGERQSVTEVRGAGRVLAAVIHDATLAQDRELVRTAASYALTAQENARLVKELRASVRELADSRARVIAGADAVRHGIEQDLHDGAQQRLIALQLRIQLAAEQLAGVSPAAAGELNELTREVELTIEEVRRLARGIYPSLLADQGLTAALRAAARGSPVRTTVDTDGIGRLPPEVERAVYFACTEALQNAIKHAAGRSGVSISLARDDGVVLFEVQDDGAGFDGDPPKGAGLANLSDRVASVGGTLVIVSEPGVGTRVSGSVPA